jgi:hypothetical protein
MLDVLNVAPTLRISVLQPNKRSADIGRTSTPRRTIRGKCAPGREAIKVRSCSVALIVCLDPAAALAGSKLTINYLAV